MKPLNKKIEELRKELDELTDRRYELERDIKPNSKMGKSSLLAVKYHIYVRKEKLQAYEEAQKIIDEKVKELKEFNFNQYHEGCSEECKSVGKIIVAFREAIDKIFGGKNEQT